MKRSRRSNRSDLRNGLRTLFGSRRGSGKAASAADLARNAGGIPEQAFESLEARQLLFTLTVDPGMVDPTTGVGTVSATFGYVIPYLVSPNQPNAPTNQPVTEDFNQGNAAIPIASGTEFQSKLTIFHTATNVTQTPITQGDNNLVVNIGSGQSVTWKLNCATAPGNGFFDAMRSLALDIGGPQGLDFANTSVELLLDGQLIRTYDQNSTPSLPSASSNGTAIGRFTFQAPAGTAFDEIRFVRRQGAAAATYTMDNLVAIPVQGRWAPILNPLIFGATVVFTGPAGASVQILDLYGRDMRETIQLKAPQGCETLRVDLDDNGIPDFNDGIGKIIISGSNAVSGFTIVGGTIDDQRGFQLVPDPVGLFNAFETAGMGFVARNTPPRVTGLPPGPGSVIIGSAWVRPQDAYNPGGGPGGTVNYSRSDQGVFVTGGSSIANVYLHALMFGSSQYTGSVDRITVGVQLGSTSVSGDLGGFISGGDAGLWVDDTNAPSAKTNSQLLVGRTLGEVDIGGRSLMAITVTGDLNRPALNPPRDVYRYYEKEWSPNIGTTPQPIAMMADILNNNNYASLNKVFGGFGRFASQASVFADTFLENDTIMGAEWVGNAATAVQIRGELGANDPVQRREDAGDVYAFPVDGTQDIVVEYTGPLAAGGAFSFYSRIVDSDGRTVASSEFPTGVRRTAAGLRYHPTGPGVYYLVVNSQALTLTTNVSDVSYDVTISGMAPTSFGAYRVAGGSGSGNPARANSISLLSGSMGSIRVGTGYVDGTGAEASPSVIYNSDGRTNDEQMAFQGSTTTIPGNLYNITTGGDIESGPVIVNVGGNLGTVITGLSAVIGQAPTQGDLRTINITTGGSIGMLDIRGALGVDQDAPGLPKPVDFLGSVAIRTGTNPNLRGDVGMIRVGSYAGGGVLSLRTPNSSYVGGFLVQQDLADNGSIYNGIYGNGAGDTGEDIRLGINSDIRFFDTPRIWLHNVPGVTYPLTGGQPVSFTDDAGGRFTIQVVGGNANAGGTVKAFPMGGSLGVAVGRVEVNLDGGAQLLITSQGNANSTDIISIGRIVITGADANSTININGPSQVDVWRIQQTGGDAFNSIANSTPNGDIVSADMVALNTLTIGTGDLGRTQLPAWGPQRISQFLGVARGAGGAVGDPIGVPGAVMTGHWNGNLYRPTNDSIALPGTSFLDDVGSPVDPYLDGLIVRTGNIATVSVGGAVGDVIAGAGNIGSVTANADRVTPAGRFEGIIGNIYANRIGVVDVGDGLAQRDQNGLSTTGIFANDDINSVVGTIPGAFISSVIEAADITPLDTDANFPIDGINSVSLTSGGSFVDAYIGSMTLDDFWTSFYADDSTFRATVGQITGTGANLLRSTVTANRINTITLTGGFYDATTTNSATEIDSITAAGFRNSTITGGDLEFHDNSIRSGNNLNLLTTFGRAGDIEDLTVDVLGRIQEVSAKNITRTSVDADIELLLLKATGDLRGSSITTGLLTNGDVDHNIRSSRISVAGPLVLLRAGDGITNSTVTVSGPDGRIERITTRQVFSGSVTSAGPIGTIEVTEGDMSINLTTLVSLRGVAGDIDTLSAGRDLDLRTDIAGNVAHFIAGRHMGSQFATKLILVRGRVDEVQIPNGQLYADLRIGQSLTTAVIGPSFNFPGGSNLGGGSIIAYGRIETVTINGDFGAKIISDSGGIGVITINNGSLVPGGEIDAFAGDISNIVINNGHLMGNVHADYNLLSIRLNGSADGVFGDIGVNPALSSGTAYDGHRNQLPPGVIAGPAVQGPSITAGKNIGRIILTNGSIFETFIWAGRAIGTIDVAGDITKDNQTPGQPNVIAAGSSIFLVHASGAITDTYVMAGVRGFGADGRPGGTAENTDAIESGRITTVRGDGAGRDNTVLAGILAGNDGVYTTADDMVALGISYVREVTFGGPVTNVKVFADSPTLTVSPGVVRGGTNLATADPDLNDGSSIAGGALVSGTPRNFTWNGVSGTLLLQGPGSVYWDQATGRVLLVNTRLDTNLTVTANGTLTNFSIVSNDDASMGNINVQANLAGNSKIVVDAYVLGIQTGGLADNSTIRVGMNVRAITTGPITGGNITAAFWARDILIAGNFGLPTTFDEASVSILAGSTLTIGGEDAGLVNVERDLSSLTVNGAMTRAQFRAGATVGSLTAGSMSETRVSIGNSVGPIVVNGDVSDTAIQVGGDLGSDAAPGGDGFNADHVSTGTIASVTIAGNFPKSSIIAGGLRGPDGYFGTDDDSVAAGRSSIGPITIAGSQVGSNLNSEQYRIYSTGTLDAVTIAGQLPVNDGNFRVLTLAQQPTPLRVVDLQVAPISNNWTATFFFNQAIDASTFGPSLTITEDRDGGQVQVPLVQGVDYTIGEFNAADNSITVNFSRDVTDRALVPQSNPDPGTTVPGAPDPSLPGPGVYRFVLSSSTMRAKVSDARLDGSAGGTLGGQSNYSQDEIVGDAGDEISPEVTNLSGDPGIPQLISMYGPADLNLVLDNNQMPDNLPETNRDFTIRGAIGDHPDNNVTNFRVGGDADVYKITLLAGQILRLGRMQGAAQFAGRYLFNANGELQGGSTPDSMSLQAPIGSVDELTTGAEFLIKTTGIYYIVIDNVPLLNNPFPVSGRVPNIPPAGGTTGDYHFTLNVFDDGDSGFAATTNAGNGAPVVNAPAPIVFAGPNGVFQNPGDPTFDDLSVVSIGGYKFFLNAGADGIRGTADDTVSGTNDNGITSDRAGNTLTSTINSAIGPIGHAGVPGDIAADVDVYNLNNGAPIAAGTRITIKIKLADLGANLGSFDQISFNDFRGDVQFGVFDTTGATGIDDGLLVFSPKDFRPVAGKPGQIAGDATSSYGYDANGDFFITFITPGRIGGAPGEAAKYAIYLQGIYNTDYTIQVTQTDNTAFPTTPQAPQNIFIETRGGTIDWLQAGGLITKLLPFSGSVLGFTGALGGMPVDQYILTHVVSTLQSIFTANGLNVRFSTNPNDFEFQDFSTVFLAYDNDPINLLTTGNYGYSQHSDPMNLDKTDEAVVFMPSLADLGYTPSQADVDNFVLSLSAAIGRRSGELMGLRISADSNFGDNPVDVMSANSVVNTPILGGVYSYASEARALSDPFDSIPDTNFFLGRQNAFALLDKFLTP